METKPKSVWQGVHVRHAVGLTLGQVYTLTDRRRTVRSFRAPAWNSTLTRRVVHTRDLKSKATTV
jgi:hypothetical protein